MRSSIHTLTLLGILWVLIPGLQSHAAMDLSFMAGYRNFSSQADNGGSNNMYVPQSGVRLAISSDSRVHPEFRYAQTAADFSGLKVTDHSFQLGLVFQEPARSPFKFQFLGGASWFLTQYSGGFENESIPAAYFGAGLQWVPGMLAFRMDLTQSLQFNFKDSSTALMIGMGVSL